MYLGNWESKEQMINDFWPDWDSYQYKGELDRANVLLASYGTPSYEGYAFVLIEEDGKLYEINGGHCSCYGLEGQWEVEETTKDALLYRLDKGSLGSDEYTENIFSTELRDVLNKLV